MTVEIRRDKEIFGTDGGWFQARWHFSFDHYYDPRQMGVGALRVFNDDRLQPGAVWPMHPHADIESCTYQGESRMLDSPESVCAGQAGFEYPATSVLFSMSWRGPSPTRTPS